jgi:hypothetical protein
LLQGPLCAANRTPRRWQARPLVFDVGGRGSAIYSGAACRELSDRLPAEDLEPERGEAEEDDDADEAPGRAGRAPEQDEETHERKAARVTMDTYGHLYDGADVTMEQFERFLQSQSAPSLPHDAPVRN